MFTETLVHAGGTSTGNATAAHVMSVLRRAVNRGYAIDFTTSGGASVTWTARRPVGETVEESPRSITFAPCLPVARALTQATCYDLLLVQARDAKYDPLRRVMTGGVWLIPQAATARLRARGLVVVDDRNRVEPSLTALIGLFARDHRTRTTEPAGYLHASDSGLATAGLNKPGRRAGMTYSGASTALCACGFARRSGDRAEARRHITGHRREVCAEFARLLVAEPAAT
ncbi:hypothetical protein [Streptomyces sp. NBC_00120]|uniref:hypothetical protein n=1 Tax=Streptomyces sp. NBC_00120 TaxID=2975660 RepID=UPI0022514BDD|nr:hypothetical protein [Streptomyces sp. NBC_00120]MCX5326320.1 hypothetical protein [Streptomyces sp. NBC_00120]